MEDEGLHLSSDGCEGEEEEGHAAGKSTVERGLADVSLAWVGAGNKVPVLLFSAGIVQRLPGPLAKPLSSPHSLKFKIVGSDCKIVRTTLLAHGFSEVSADSNGFNVMWSGPSTSGTTTRFFLPFQKVNHFPRSAELTRKDKMCTNIQRMQEMQGMRHFNIIPKTFVLPKEYTDFCSNFRQKQGTWIVKPVASSRGRGISIITHPSQLARDEPVVVSRYLDNPRLVDGFKFDLRLYVAVTSFEPLRVYLYEEGLARFASVQYSQGGEELDNHWMHLTNYSVNRKNVDYVRCEDPDLEDYGNKWSMSALLRHLHGEGANVAELTARVEDVIIKSLLSAEGPIVTACRMFQPHRGSCFELYGYDILVDENLQPWLLEVNLSPSLACDAPMDLRIKSNLVADLLSLTGIVVQDPSNSEASCQRHQRPHSSHPVPRRSTGRALLRDLRPEEVAMVREVREEYHRRGGFVRIFPTEDTWDLYGSFFEVGQFLNFVLHSQLYPKRVKNQQPRPVTLNTIIAKRLRNLNSTALRDALKGAVDSPAGLTALQRAAIYLRRLPSRLTPADGGVAAPPTTPPTSTLASNSQETQTQIIKNAAKMTKLQARSVFAAYLECVQRRLMRETSGPSLNVTAGENAQLNVDLVVRFLEKAASNLHSPFTVVVPNHKLPLRDRRRLLAKQLEEFVVLYRKETSELDSRERKTPERASSRALIGFLSEMNEDNLERLLSVYARHSKSSSVLLTAVEQQEEVGEDAAKLHGASRHQLAKEEPASSVASPDRTDSAACDRDTVGRSQSLTQFSPPSYPWVLPPATKPHRPKEHLPPFVRHCSNEPPPSTTPQHPAEVLHSSSVQLGSLEKLTRNLSSWIPPAHKAPERADPLHSTGKQNSRRPSSGGRLRAHQRSLSLQSLASTSSTLSHTSDTQSSVSSTRRRSGRLRPTISSKSSTYVSPYAQQVCTRTTTKKRSVTNSRTHGSDSTHLSLHPALSEDSITQALQKLSRRQKSRTCAAPRGPVLAKSAPHGTQIKQSSPLVDQRILKDAAGHCLRNPPQHTGLTSASPLTYNPSLYSSPHTNCQTDQRINSHSMAIQQRLLKAMSVPPFYRPSDFESRTQGPVYHTL